MFILFGNKIEKLEKIVKKAIEKAIKYGNKLIELYENAQESVEKIKIIVEKLTYILAELKKEETEDDVSDETENTDGE